MRARRGTHILADTVDAVALRESTYPVVRYFARGDVETGYFAKTAKTSHCPYKGDASYYTVTIDGEVLENVAWSYEDPYPAMEAIRGRIAFYPDRIEVYEVSEAELESRHSAA